MSPEIADQKAAQQQALKKAYTTPQLLEHGTIAHITASIREPANVVMNVLRKPLAY